MAAVKNPSSATKTETAKILMFMSTSSSIPGIDSARLRPSRFLRMSFLFASVFTPLPENFELTPLAQYFLIVLINLLVLLVSLIFPTL